MKFFIAIVFVFGSVNALAEKWKMTSLEWPPFVCEKCPEQGAGAKALREALKTVGVELELVLLPWTRAINEAADAKNYVGGFLYYYDEVPMDKGFVRSEPVFKSPIGLMELKGKGLAWNKLTDLKGKNLGTVQDYFYNQEMMDLFKAGTIRADVAQSDDVNIKKLVGGRIDAAVIDLNVGKYIVQNDFKDHVSKIQYNPKVIDIKDLFAGFNKQHADKNAKLTAALKNVNVQKIVDDYLKANLKN